MAKTFKNFIAGEWVAPSTGEYMENRNPADWRDLIGRFPKSGPRDVGRALEQHLLREGPEDVLEARDPDLAQHALLFVARGADEAHACCSSTCFS